MLFQGSNSIINSTFGMAESMTQAVAGRMTPLAQKVAPALVRVDDLAIKGLDQLTTILPVVQLKPEEVHKNMHTNIPQPILCHLHATSHFCLLVLNYAYRALNTHRILKTKDSTTKLTNLAANTKIQYEIHLRTTC